MLLAGEDDDPLSCAKAADDLGVSSEASFHRDCVDLVLGYLSHVLEDGTLNSEDARDIGQLKARLQLRFGEFREHRLREVTRILREEFERVLADGRIDREEDLYQVELQRIFDLGYDEYLALIRDVLELHWSDGRERLTLIRSADPTEAMRLEAELVAIEPLYRLAAGKPRPPGLLW